MNPIRKLNKNNNFFNDKGYIKGIKCKSNKLKLF